MEAPEPGDVVVGAVQQGLGHVGHEHGDQELRPHRQRLDGGLERRERRQPGDGGGGGSDQDQDELHQYMAHEEVRHVGAPARPQRRQRAFAQVVLQRHEHQCGKEQRQHEPVQPQRVGCMADGIELHVGAAQQHGKRGTGHAQRGDAFVAVAQDRHGTHEEGGGQPDQQQVAGELLVVDRAELAAGQQLGKMEAGHGEQAQQAEQGGTVGKERTALALHATTSCRDAADSACAASSVEGCPGTVTHASRRLRVAAVSVVPGRFGPAMPGWRLRDEHAERSGKR